MELPGIVAPNAGIGLLVLVVGLVVVVASGPGAVDAANIVVTGDASASDGTAIFEGHGYTPAAPLIEIFGGLPTSPTTSAPQALSILSTSDMGGTRYVEFAIDMNETGSKPSWEIATFSVSVGATVVYSGITFPAPQTAADRVVFDGSAGGGSNNGGGDIDGSIWIPESLFQGQGFAATDTFTVTASFDELHNGADSLLAGPGDGTPLDPTVPEPSTAVLVGLSLLACSMRRRPR